MHFDNPLLDKSRAIPSTLIFDSKIKKPRVTIAIPTYCREDLLEIAVDSAVTQQDFDDFEVLVVDNNPARDCNTERLMAKYADNPHVTYYKNTENVGMVCNWNKLYLLAKGDYVVMLHDDDHLYPDFLHRLFVDYHGVVEANDITFPSFCSRQWFRDNYDGPRCILKWKADDFLIHNLVGAPLGMTMRRDVALNVGGFSDKCYPALDEEFYVRALAQGLSLVTIYDRPFAFYRDVDNTSSNARTFIAFYLTAGPAVFNAYSAAYNPVLRALRKAAGESFALYKLRHHSREKDIADNSEIQSAISALAKRATIASKAAFRLFMALTPAVMSLSRRFRTHKL